MTKKQARIGLLIVAIFGMLIIIIGQIFKNGEFADLSLIECYMTAFIAIMFSLIGLFIAFFAIVVPIWLLYRLIYVAIKGNDD